MTPAEPPPSQALRDCDRGRNARLFLLHWRYRLLGSTIRDIGDLEGAQGITRSWQVPNALLSLLHWRNPLVPVAEGREMWRVHRVVSMS